MDRAYVHVFPVLLEHHRLVERSALLAPIALQWKHVLIRNVLTHVLDLVVYLHCAK